MSNIELLGNIINAPVSVVELAVYETPNAEVREPGRWIPISFLENLMDEISDLQKDVASGLMNSTWDKRFLALARHISEWSKDPSTKTGAVIVDQSKRIVSVGYNGLPQNVYDDMDILNNRELKYQSIIHCEVNAILFSNRDLSGMTLYTWPFQSCSNCASIVIQSGISRHVYPKIDKNNELFLRWKDKFDLSERLFRSAGVELVEVDVE